MKRGFTLLELLISCSLLIVVLGILTLAINRAHQIRQEATRRTTLLTQGRAALDTIAEDLQNIIGTNLETLAGTAWMAESYESTNNVGLHLTRTVSHPRGTIPGQATAPPVEDIYYQVVATNKASGLKTFFLNRGREPYASVEETTDTDIGSTVTRELKPTGESYDVTNVVARLNTTLIPPGQKGDIIPMPINSVSSTRIYDWSSSTSAWLDVMPTSDANTNRVVATVIFSNAFTSVSVYTNTPAAVDLPAGFWPSSPYATVSTGYQAMAFVMTAGHRNSNSISNTPTANASLPAGAVGLFTNTLPVNVTNITDATHHAAFTNEWHVHHWEQAPPPHYTNTFVGVLYAWTNFPAAAVSNAWVIPPATNAAVAGVQGRSASFDWASWDTTAAPIPYLTNLPWRIGIITNTHLLPSTATISPPVEYLPLSFHMTNVFAFAVNGSAFETLSTNFSVALAHGDTLAPIQTQIYWRASETVATNQVTPTNLLVTVWQRVQQVTTNVLETFVPATLVTNGHYRYDPTLSTRKWVDTIRYTDTIWVLHTLIEDYGGGPAEVYSLWLAEDIREKSQFNYSTNSIQELSGRPHTKDDGARSDDEVIDGVAAFHCQPLCFVGDGEDEPWRLAIWSPGDAEPPVCIDIYLEILDPRVARRAAAMTDETKRKAFVARHVMRLTKRVPLRPYNRWRVP